MKITQMLNSKYIFTFLVLTRMVLAPITSPATLHNAIHAKSAAVASLDSWEVPIAKSGKMIG